MESVLFADKNYIEKMMSEKYSQITNLVKFQKSWIGSGDDTDLLYLNNMNK